MRVPASTAPQVAWGNGDSGTPGPTSTAEPPQSIDMVTHERRTVLQREFDAVQQARAIQQASTRARLAELQQM